MRVCRCRPSTHTFTCLSINSQTYVCMHTLAHTRVRIDSTHIHKHTHKHMHMHICCMIYYLKEQPMYGNCFYIFRSWNHESNKVTSQKVEQIQYLIHSAISGHNIPVMGARQRREKVGAEEETHPSRSCPASSVQLQLPNSKSSPEPIGGLIHHRV